MLLAVTLARMGRQTAALAALKRAVAAEPRHPEAQFQLGILQTDLRAYAEAEAAFRAAEAAGNRSADLQLRLGQVLLMQGDEAGAEAAYETGLAREPDHAMLLSRKALLLQGRGAFAEAEALLRRAIELAPGTGEFYRILSASLKMTPEDPLLFRDAAPVRRPGHGRGRPDASGLRAGQGDGRPEAAREPVHLPSGPPTS